MVALPRGLGQWLLGPIWKPTYELVLPTTLFMMGGCVSAGAATYMRALGAARRSVRAALFTSISFLVGSLVGAVEGGAVGAVSGAAAARFLGSLVYWWQLRIDPARDAWHPYPRDRPQRATLTPAARIRLPSWVDAVDRRPTAGSRCRWSVAAARPRRQLLGHGCRRRLVANAQLLVVVSPCDRRSESLPEVRTPQSHAPNIRSSPAGRPRQLIAGRSPGRDG